MIKTVFKNLKSESSTNDEYGICIEYGKKEEHDHYIKWFHVVVDYETNVIYKVEQCEEIDKPLEEYSPVGLSVMVKIMKLVLDIIELSHRSGYSFNLEHVRTYEYLTGTLNSKDIPEEKLFDIVNSMVSHNEKYLVIRGDKSPVGTSHFLDEAEAATQILKDGSSVINMEEEINLAVRRGLS